MRSYRRQEVHSFLTMVKDTMQKLRMIYRAHVLNSDGKVLQESAVQSLFGKQAWRKNTCKQFSQTVSIRLQPLKTKTESTWRCGLDSWADSVSSCSSKWTNQTNIWLMEMWPRYKGLESFYREQILVVIWQKKRARYLINILYIYEPVERKVNIEISLNVSRQLLL